MYDHRGINPKIALPIKSPIEPVKLPSSLGERSYPPEFSPIYLGRGFHAQALSIGTTPTKIIHTSRSWPYLLVNPHTKNAGVNEFSIDIDTTSSGFYPSTLTPGTLAGLINVEGQQYLHIHMMPGYITGKWDIQLESYEPTNLWGFTVQDLFMSVEDQTQLYYTMVGPYGLAKYVQIRITNVVAGTLRVTMNLFFKNFGGNEVDSSYYTKSIYIGSDAGVTTSNGIPIVPGSERMYIIGENTEVWAVAGATCSLRILQL
jgi:hypothetical protein